MTGGLACRGCGTALYAPWWEDADSGYRCRRCGALTEGPKPAGYSSPWTTFLVIGGWSALVLGGGFLITYSRSEEYWGLGFAIFFVPIWLVGMVLLVVSAIRQSRSRAR